MRRFSLPWHWREALSPFLALPPLSPKLSTVCPLQPRNVAMQAPGEFARPGARHPSATTPGQLAARRQAQWDCKPPHNFPGTTGWTLAHPAHSFHFTSWLSKSAGSWTSLAWRSSPKSGRGGPSTGHPQGWKGLAPSPRERPGFRLPPPEAPADQALSRFGELPFFNVLRAASLSMKWSTLRPRNFSFHTTLAAMLGRSSACPTTCFFSPPCVRRDVRSAPHSSLKYSKEFCLWGQSGLLRATP